VIPDAALLIVAGLILLWFGSDFVVTAARNIAQHLKMSPLFVGLVITAAGTSLPEISNNVMTGIANLTRESSGIGLGNVLGANMANITLLLGGIALFLPFSLRKNNLSRDGGFMIVALCLAFLAAADLRISRLEAASLLIAYLVYLVYIIRHERIVLPAPGPGKKEHPLVDAGLLTAGFAMVLGGGYLVVNSGVSLAQGYAVPNYVVGVFLGIGTTLPELSVSLRAALRKYHALFLGNLIGSNITNSLLALGGGAVISGYAVRREVLLFDFPYLLAVSAIIFLMLFRYSKLGRREGIMLLLFYLLFIYLNVVVGRG